MRTKGFSFLLPLVMITGAPGCDNVAFEGAQVGARAPASHVSDRGSVVEVTDDAGRVVVLERHPERVISLVPSATRMLIALGEGSRLVARTDFDPPDSAPELANLPTVGGGLGPSVERIVSLQADLVIRFDADSDPATPRLLDAAGVPHVAIRPDQISDVRRIIALLGQIMGADGPADLLVSELDETLAEVSRRVDGARRPLVAFLLGGDPPLVPGPGTYLQELVALAGGRNAFEDLGSLYAPVSVEEVIRRDVEIILAPEGATIPVALGGLPIRRVSPGIELPGIHVGTHAQELARILHSERFP